MPILVTPIRGRSIPLYVSTTETSKLGSDIILQFEIVEDEFNYQIVRGLQKRWTISRVQGPKDKREYVVFIIDRQTHGKKQLVSVSCRYKPLDIIKHTRVYETIDGSFTADKFLKQIFDNTGLKYKINGSLGSSQFENAGEGESLEDLIKKFCSHFDVEFDIEFNNKSGTYTFVFTPFLNKNASYHIDDEINANNMKIEEDSSELYTYAVGYGDYDEEEGSTAAGFVMKFEHPSIKDYGRYDAPPIKDGRIKDEEVMHQKLQSLIESSVKTSISLDFIALNEHYRNAVPKVADIVKINHSILGINEFVRIVDVKTVRDKDNIIVKQDVTLGDFKRVDRYKKRVSEAAAAVGKLGGQNSFVHTYKVTTAKTNAAIKTTQRQQEDNATKDIKAIKEDGTVVNLSSADIVIDANGNLKLK